MSIDVAKWLTLLILRNSKSTLLPKQLQKGVVLFIIIVAQNKNLKRVKTLIFIVQYCSRNVLEGDTGISTFCR